MVLFSILMASTHPKPERTGVTGVAHIYNARLAVLFLCLLTCFWGIWNSGRAGLSQLLAGHSLLTDRLEEADRAVNLDPALPEAYYVRARLLFNRSQLPQAIKAYEHAVALRPNDYALWLELGQARDQANDVRGALAAFNESTRLAPFYAKPHLQLANTLFRAGRRDEAFIEFRRAVTSNPQLLPQTMNLIWVASGGDTNVLEQALQPGTQSAHLALASFFASHGKPSESLAQFRAAGDVSPEQRRVVLTALLQSKNFVEAFEVWSSGRQRSGENGQQSVARLANVGFEQPIVLDDPGFEWQLSSNLQSVRASLDPDGPRVGSYSLRLDWSGESSPSSPIISQLVLVELQTRYRLSFAVRTREMLTIGLPVVTVTDPGSDTESLLIQSQPFPRGTSGWQDYAIDFATTETTRAVRIAIRRQDCATNPCAAIGHAWVDDFSLQKVQ